MQEEHNTDHVAGFGWVEHYKAKAKTERSIREDTVDREIFTLKTIHVKFRGWSRPQNYFNSEIFLIYCNASVLIIYTTVLCCV